MVVDQGFKPSFASVPLDGIFPLSSSLDHVGPIASSVEDARLLFEVIAGRPVAKAPDVHSLRVGWITSACSTSISSNSSRVGRFSGLP